LDPGWLLVLVPVWPLALLALVRGRYPPAARTVLAAAAVNFFLYAVTWANHQSRYQLLTLLLLLPFAVEGLARLGDATSNWRLVRSVTALHLAVLVVALFWSQTSLEVYRGQFRYQSRERWEGWGLLVLLSAGCPDWVNACEINCPSCSVRPRPSSAPASRW
jgi:hypothetical protein